MRTNKLLRIGGVLLAIAALNAAVWAQGEADKTATAWPKKPNFSIRLGSYFTNNTGQIRIDGANGEGTVIDLKDVLGIPKNATVFRARADVRVASWFGLEGEFYRISRSKTAVIDREITVGDEVFPINETISSHFAQNFLDLALKFYLFHRQRWDLGLWLGANVHFPAFSLDAQPSDMSVSRKTWYPIPSLGVVGSYTILPRLYLYGKAGYFKYSADSISFDSVRFDISVDYYIWKSLGVGMTYEYYDSSVDKTASQFNGMIKGTTSGFQIYGVIGF
jgi:hypothetical protein